MEEQLGMMEWETEAVFEVLMDELDEDAKMEAFTSAIHTEDIVRIVSSRITELEASDDVEDLRRSDVLRDANTNMMANEGML